MSNAYFLIETFKIALVTLLLVCPNDGAPEVNNVKISNSKQNIKSTQTRAEKDIVKRSSVAADSFIPNVKQLTDASENVVNDDQLNKFLLMREQEKRGRYSRLRFVGSLGKRDVDYNEDLEKRARYRNKAFFASLGKRTANDNIDSNSNGYIKTDPDSYDKRGKYNQMFGSLGKREESQNEMDKRRFFVSLGKREDAQNEMDKRRFFVSLGKREDPQNEIEKRRFFVSLGKRGDELEDESINKRRMFIPTLGKRQNDESFSDSLEDVEMEKRKMHFMVPMLGKRSRDDDVNEDIEKRRMYRMFTQLGKRSRYQSPRGIRRFRFTGSLGKRSGTLTDEEEALSDREEFNKRFNLKAFRGSLGKRSSSGTATDEQTQFEVDKKAYIGRPSRRRYFVQLGKRSVENSDEQQKEVKQQSRHKRSVPYIFRSSGINYYRPRRRISRLVLRRLGRRAPDYRFIPTLGKRTGKGTSI